MPKTLYLIDTYAQIFRSFFAIRTDMRSEITGEPTQAVFGMTGLLIKLMAKFQPDYVVAAVDAPGPTFRDALHESYKGTRNETPADLTAQIPRILSLMEAMGIPCIAKSGLEADDLIANIVRNVMNDPEAEDVQIRIASKDKDLLQLLNERVTMYDIQTEVETDTAALLTSKGITPGQVIDYLTLTGDTVDNVPGVPGIGPKTAAQLLTQFGTLDGIYANLDALTPRQRELLTTAREQTVLSRVLVTLKDDDDLGFRLSDARPRGVDLPTVLELFRQCGFNRFADEVRRLPSRERSKLDRILEDSDPFAEDSVSTEPTSVELAEFPIPPIRRITTADELCVLSAELQLLLRAKVGVDLLTLAVQTDADTLSAIALANESEAEIAVIQLSEGGISAEILATELGPLLEDGTIAKAVHEGKVIAHALLRQTGITLRGVVFDTHLAARLAEHDAAAELGLLISTHLAYTSPDLSTENPVGTALRAAAVRLLVPVLRSQLDARGMRLLAEEIEGPLSPILARMEHLGILCDPEELVRQGTALGARVVELRQSVYEAAGFEFELNSTQQLAEALFTQLGLKPGKRNKTGYSTDKEVLETLADEEHPNVPATQVPRLILEYRQLTKLLSTYLDNLRVAIRPETGRIHTSFRQLATATGRLASDGPNLQNIPVRSEVGRQIRAAFHAPSDCVLISVDYSQVELRLLAHLSRDPTMIDAFQKGMDIHTSVAMQVFGVEAEEAVTRAQRDQAKTINFGIVYGISPFGLARRIKTLDRAAAEVLIGAYRAHYAGIDRFLQECIEVAKRDGFVTTISGRRRPIPELKSRSTTALGERLAINTVVQGSAADLIKSAMVRIQNRIDSESLPARMLLQIHDELVFECPVNAAEDCALLFKSEMEGAMSLTVPLVAEYGIGVNWRDAK